MNLNRQEQSKLIKVYDTWLHSYLNGDVETYDSFLDDDYHFIGSATKEEFLNKKDTTKFFADTGDQFAGKTEIRNESKIIEQFGELIFITHVFDAWFLHEKEWNFYSRFRLSSTLRKNKDGWRFIYQHFSIPDPKTAEGETIGYDKINEENQELREAIQRRTTELEKKNRELEVETALERIRGQAVAMKQSTDLLDIVVTMRNEFIKLGHEAHYFWHMMWLPKTYEKAMTSGDGTKIGFVMQLPRHIHGNIPLLAKWEKSKKPTVVYAMNIDEAIDYVDKMVSLGDFKNIDPQAPTHDDIRNIGGLTFIMARTTHGEIGYSLPGVVKNPPKEDIDILVKFAGAFDLAHQRFLDLQNAEKQAKETQIELALEKVRSRTMAMQKSEELSEASFLLDAQVRELGIKTWGCAFNIYGEKESTEWFGNEAGILHTYTVPREGIFKEYYDKGQKGETLVIQEFSGDDCVVHYEYMSSLPVIGDVLKTLKKTNKGFPTYQIDHVVYFKYGYLLFITRESVPDAHEIFKRFAKVFEQTYTRFLDLKKAEAQAREAKIEVALERVRARTMAMHKSQELKEVVSVMYNEMELLGLAKWGCNIMIFHEESTQIEFWLAEETDTNHTDNYFAKGKEHPVYRKLWNHWKKQGPPLTLHHRDTYKREFDEYWLNKTDFKRLPDVVKKSVFDRNEVFLNYATMRYGMLNAVSYVPINNEILEILARFAKVFEQTYTRFLDLQKAEAQAKEAQIETALERVRSASMAMHKSEEMQIVVDTIYEQLNALNFEMHAVGMSGAMNPKKGYEVWAGGIGLKAPLQIPYNEETKVQRDYNKVLIKRTELFAKTYKGKIKKEYIDFLLRNNKFPPFLEKLMVESNAFSTTLATSKNSGMQILRYTEKPYTDTETAILLRFAKVFEQTYTRFLDLKKAEAQAREAQIEVAIERVRSRSMAMHKSDELKEVVKVIFDQMAQLKINAEHAGIVVDFQPKKDFHFWVADNQDIPAKITVPYLDLPWDKQFTEAKKKGKEFFTTQLDFKEKNSFYKQLLPHIKGLTKKAKDFYLKCPGLSGSTVIQKDIGLYIENFSGTPFSDEDNLILKRFGKVFQQSYTRFLDLQKAEEQTREAQIETALERVRSRSLAMHKSSELSAVVDTLLQEFTNLDITLTFCIINLVNEADKSNTVWAANPETGKDPESYYMKFEDYPFHHAMWDAWKTQKKRFVYTISGKEKKVYDSYLFSDTEFKRFPKHVQEANKALERYVAGFTFSKYSGLQAVSENDISEEELAILERFGKVFEQAYIRFLDLQKAEAQAREAQIEVSLEKVRSRSMAMHKSDELLDVITVVSEQLIALGFRFHHVSFANNNIDETYKFWTSTNGITQPMRFVVPYIDIPMFNNIILAQKNSASFFSDVLTQKENQEWHEHLLKNDSLAKVFSKEDNAYFMSKGMARSIAINPNIMLILANYASAPYSKEENRIIERFGQVFEQTYTRFLDLKKVEAQAREAQIETALEKVRSRTMAMQHSDELPEAANNLFLQVQALGIPAWSAGYCIWENKDRKSAWCNMSSEGEIQKGFSLPTINEGYNFYKPFNNNEPFHVAELGGEKLVKHYDFMKKLPIVGAILKEFDKKGITLPTFQIFHIVYFTHGYLMFITYEAVPKDWEVFKRFGKVFEQTYTRFLDLQKAEALAVKAKEDLVKIKTEKKRAEDALTELQSTQKQLIQSEKMASLGELTAGIAHEIQNPLNFVNNFSELSEELLDELKDEIKGKPNENLEEIFSDLKQNLNKINNHGKRASNIVKGMLEHSRTSSGIKELTDINLLADEYLRLSYHGLRAKDKSFNAVFKTDLDPSLPKIDIVAQDFGRVILNLINNAFYTVDKKGKVATKEYQPLVTLTTRKNAKSIEIIVNDNGNGISRDIKEKIFQPFFTTKPTGEGTGLGLSLAYDIITKGHRGELKVTSKEGEGTQFRIILPLKE